MLDMDFETYSETPIKNGTHAYAENAEIIIFAYGIDGGPEQTVDYTRASKGEKAMVDDIINESRYITAHNSHFDRTIMSKALNTTRAMRAAALRIESWRDTMVQAMVHGLPGSLDALCEILKVDADKAKNKKGKALIHLFCKPRKFSHRIVKKDYPNTAAYRAALAEARENWQGRATGLTHPTEWFDFMEYAGDDIVAMRAIRDKLPTWNYQGEELALWHLDQRINDRGTFIDMDLVHAATRAVEREMESLAEQTVIATNGEVTSTNKRDALILHILTAYGIVLPDLKGSTVESYIDNDSLPPELRALLVIRAAASTTSTSKYKALLRGVSSDGRLRGLLQYAGALRTLRWAGRLFQPQNLPRPTLKQKDIDAGIKALLADCADLIVPDIMRLASSCIRGVIAAPPGKKLVIADLSNIEGRAQAWLAGETWKLKAFRDFDTLVTNDRGTVLVDAKGKPLRMGPDLYKLAYSRAFNMDAGDVDDSGRQIGKVMELGLGYEGGVGAFLVFALTYNLDLEEMAALASTTIPPEVWGQANIMLEWHKEKGRDPARSQGLSEKVWLTCESFKIAWRYAHPRIASYWKDLDAAMREAIEYPGVMIPCRKIRMIRKGAWLRILMPSGRSMCYPAPAIIDNKITFMGVDQFTRKWTRQQTYGGKIFENCIAEDTPVLTRRGWVPIQNIQPQEEVWDGLEWVKQDGCIYKGKVLTIDRFGVRMTPDHKVLTTRGWKSASSSEGHKRASVGLPDSGKLCGVGRPKILMACEVRMREAYNPARYGVKETEVPRGNVILRLSEESVYRHKKYEARDVLPSGIRGLAIYVGSVFSSLALGLAQLRGTGYSYMQTMANKFCSVLGRYGDHLRTRRNARTFTQRPRIFSRELCMADSQTPGQQPTGQSEFKHPYGRYVAVRSGATIRRETKYAGMGVGPPLAATESARSVYDLVNCGPRSRFVVLGSDGEPLIVHNCCQAFARDIIAYNMPEIEANAYFTTLTVHDEVICETEDEEHFNEDELSSLLAANPSWAPDMPLAAAGFQTYRYKKG